MVFVVLQQGLAYCCFVEWLNHRCLCCVRVAASFGLWLRESSKEKLLVKISKLGMSCGFSRLSSCFLS